jgi:ubiquinone/menaquinone biosynthesis C-methylase UbiE
MGRAIVNIQDLYNLPLMDLGAIDAKLSGIYSQGFDTTVVRQYMSSQFLEDAQIYADIYTNDIHWNWLVETGLKISSIKSRHSEKLNVLDIGSGAGNTIWPLVKELPNADIIASDLSIPMLSILKQELIRRKLSDITIMQLNAEDMHFREGSFDLIMGGSILHHLINPDIALSQIRKTLKGKGVAIFYEPFEIGNNILSLTYQLILNDKKIRRKISVKTRDFLHALVVDIQARRKVEKDWTKRNIGLDDKWLFTSSYFRKKYRDYGFSGMNIFPTTNIEHLFESKTEVYLQVGIKGTHRDLPEGAWQILRQLDTEFSEDAKNDMLIEGCIVFYA